MNKLAVQLSFILPQYRSLFKEIPNEQSGEFVKVFEIPESQWNTFHRLQNDDEYTFGKVNGLSVKKIKFKNINHSKSNKVTVVYTVDKTENDTIVTIKLAFHGEFINTNKIGENELPINFALVTFDESTDKSISYKWS